MSNVLKLSIQEIKNSTMHFSIELDNSINASLTFELHCGVSEDYMAYSTTMTISKDITYWISHPCLVCFSEVRLLVYSQDRILLLEYLIEDLDKQSNHAINFLGEEVYNKIVPYLNWTYFELFAEGEIDRAGLDKRSANVFANCKNVVDLGSNIGFFGKYVSRHTTLDNYICVEPNNNFNYPNEVINQDLAKNHKIYNSAFYNEDDKEVKYYMTKKPIDWSINTIDAEFKEEFKYLVNSEFEETTTSTITLKKIMEDNNLEVIDFLKVDIEGAERYLLESENFNILKENVKYISVEVHSEELREKFAEVFSKNEFRIESTHSIHFQINNTKFSDVVGGISGSQISDFPHKKILLRINCVAMGDSLCSTPTIRKVFNSYGHKIFIQTYQSLLFRHNPYLQQVYNFKEYLDYNLFDDIFDTFGSFIRVSRGTDSSKYGQDVAVKLSSLECRQMHALGIGMSLYPDEMSYDYYPDNQTKESKKVDKEFIILHITQNWPNRTWEDDQWQRLIDLIKGNTNFKIAIVGKSHKEFAYHGDIKKEIIYLRDVDLDFCLREDVKYQKDIDPESGTLSELWHVLNNGFGLVSFDGGPIHLAGTTDSYIFQIGASIRPEKTSPYRNGTQNYKFSFIGGECKKFCGSDLKYSVKEWGTINSMPYYPACQEGYDKFYCHPTPEQVFLKICEMKDMEDRK